MAIGTDTRVDQLDELLKLLTQGPQSEESEMAQEHLQGARTYLLAAMNDEYILNIELAREAIGPIPDDRVRAEALQLLSNLEAEETARPTEPGI